MVAANCSLVMRYAYCLAAIAWISSPTVGSMKVPSASVAHKGRGLMRSKRQQQQPQRRQEQQRESHRGPLGFSLRSSTREDLGEGTISDSLGMVAATGNRDTGDDENDNENDDNDKDDPAKAAAGETSNDNSGNSDEVVIALLERDGAALDPLPPDRELASARWRRRKQVAAGLVASIATTAWIASRGWLPGPAGGGAYTLAMIARDAGMAGLTSVLAVALNRGITTGFERGAYGSKTARKLTHILSAPLFVATWPFFSDAAGARVFAGLVCLTNMLRLYLAGTGDAAESSLARTISRSGDKREVMQGPFIYVCIFQAFILAFWRDTFPGVVAMTTMAAGDGMADVVGRRFGRKGYKWPFSDGEKSLAGTAGFFAFALAGNLAVCSWLAANGCLDTSLGLPALALRIAGLSAACAVVEVLPVGDDNYTVPGTAALLAALWLR